MLCCDDCAKKYRLKQVHLLRSYGSCEYCGNARVCTEWTTQDFSKGVKDR